MVNDPTLTQRMLPSLARVAGGQGLVELPYVTGAEDFAFFGERVPSLLFFVGSPPAGRRPMAESQ